MFETSFIEINADRYQANLAFLKDTFASHSEICLVIKGNAYGHGADLIMELAQSSGFNTFAVFSAEEALRVLDTCREDTRLIIMGDIDCPQIEWAIDNGLEFHINNSRTLFSALRIAREMGQKAKIHLEFETGMNRLGIDSSEFEAICSALLESSENHELKGFCTHFAGAESIANFSRVQSQITKFKEISAYFEKRGLKAHQCHAACSAVAIRFPEARYNMIRVGILQYGFWPSHETFIEFITGRADKVDPLRRVITWKSRVMTTKAVPSGQYVGYGTSFRANTDKRLAVVPIGYVNGFARSLSNQGRVLIRGRPAAVVGTVNMNVLTVDITDIPGVSIGDEVVLVGEQGESVITVASFSDFSNQLNYELLSRLSHDIPRIVI